LIKKEDYDFLHDLTNKLSKIDGYSEMLKAVLGDDQDMLLKIEKANSEAIELIKTYKKNLESRDQSLSQLPAQKKCHVLVADDEEDLRDILTLILSRFGLQVSTVSDGKSALEMIKKSKFDLIISDMKMPFLDGFSLLEQLRSDKEVHQPKFLFISGDIDMDLEKMQFLKEFSDGILPKPFQPNLIYEKIDEMFPGQLLKKT
jgi:CheY-like chemotaxis protein